MTAFHSASRSGKSYPLRAKPGWRRQCRPTQGEGTAIMAIATINPATGEVIKTFQPLAEAEIEKKLQLAVRVFKSEAKTPFAVRAQRMIKAAQIVERDKEKFAHLMTLEMGKTYKSAVAEAVKCTTACRYYAENTERFLADEVVETGAKKSFIRYLPIG